MNLTELIVDARGRGERPQMHPNGFMQLLIGGERGAGTRLHLWKRSYPHQPNPTPIHDHNFDMRSVVFRGRLVNVDYVTRSGSEFEKYLGTPEGMVPVGETCSVSVDQSVVVMPGDSYVVGAFEFHETIPAETSVSVIEMRPVESRLRPPTILVPAGKTPDPFIRGAFDPDWMWHEILNETRGL